MNVKSFFGFFLPQWVLRGFKSEESISQNSAVKADPNHLPDSQSGSLVSLEAHPTPEDRSPCLHCERLKVELDSDHGPNKPGDDVVKKLKEQQLTTESSLKDSNFRLCNEKEVLAVKLAESLLDSLKDNIALLIDNVRNLSISENNWKTRALQNEHLLTLNMKELKSLRLSNADKEKHILKMEKIILDLQSKILNVIDTQSYPTNLVSLPITYDRAFLLQRRSLGIKKPEGLPIEIVRESTTERDVSRVDDTSIVQLADNIDEPPCREIKLSNMKPECSSDDTNTWKPKRVTSATDNPTGTEIVLKTFRGILNKMTPSKHVQFMAKLQALEIEDEERLSEVIKLVFQKALDEPMFASTYAQMCKALATKQVMSSTNPTESVSFRTLLLSRCRRVFEKDSANLVDVENKQKEIQNAETEEEKKQLQTELNDIMDRNRRITLSNIKFIGELYRVGNVSENVMHNCIRCLLTKSDDEAIESLCRLLTTIGKELDNPTNLERMNSYFNDLDAMTKENKISNRIRFMIQDICDLRNRGWKPRHELNSSPKVEQKDAIVPSKTEISLSSSSDHQPVADCSSGPEETILGELGSFVEPVKNVAMENTQENAGKSIVEEQSPIFQYSDFRYTNKPVSGYNVLPTVASATQDLVQEYSSKKPTPSSSIEENKDSEDNFTISLNSTTILEIKNQIVLKNVANVEYGRIVGREGSNVKRLSKSYGVEIKSQRNETTPGNFDFIISGSKAKNRRGAADDLIDILSASIVFSNSKIAGLKKSVIKKIAFSNYVQVNLPINANETVTICGKLSNCKKAFEQLVSGA